MGASRCRCDSARDGDVTDGGNRTHGTAGGDMGQSVSNVVARSILGFLQTQGVAIQPLMAQCGISRYELDKIDGRLSAIQHFRFIHACAIYQTQWIRARSRTFFEQQNRN